MGRASALRYDLIGKPDPPEPRFRVYRLCECETCDGSGKQDVSLHGSPRCADCRGEGRTLDLVATCDTPADLGLAIVTLGTEGEFDECPVGVLNTLGEKGKKWIVSPWQPSPRNASDAGKLLRSVQLKGEK